MERRKFINSIGMGSLALPLLSFQSLPTDSKQGKDEIILPPSLEEGDTVAIVSPASAIFESEPYEIAGESFEALGLLVKFGAFSKSR